MSLDIDESGTGSCVHNLRRTDEVGHLRYALQILALGCWEPRNLVGEEKGGLNVLHHHHFCVWRGGRRGGGVNSGPTPTSIMVGMRSTSSAMAVVRRPLVAFAIHGTRMSNGTLQSSSKRFFFSQPLCSPRAQLRGRTEIER